MTRICASFCCLFAEVARRVGGSLHLLERGMRITQLGCGRCACAKVGGSISPA